MRFSKLIAIALFVTGSFFCSVAQAETVQNHPKKIYVDSQAVKVTKKGFLVMTPGGGILLKTLRSDGIGVYFFKNDCTSQKRSFLREKRKCQCPTCHRIFDDLVDLYIHFGETGHG